MICRHFVLECTIFLEKKARKNHAKKFFWRTILYWKHSRLSSWFLALLPKLSLSLSFLAMVPLFVVLSRSIFYGMRGTEPRRVLCCCCFRTVVWSFSPFFSLCCASKTCLGRKSSTKEYKSDFTNLSSAARPSFFSHFVSLLSAKACKGWS